MRTDDVVFLLIALPLAGAGCVLLGTVLRSRWVKQLMAHLGAFLALGAVWLPLVKLAGLVHGGQRFSGTIGGWASDMGIQYQCDGLALLVIALGMVLAIPSWMYSRSLNIDHRVFDCVFFIQAGFLAAIAMTADLFNLFVCLEVLGMTSYVLIVFSKKPQAYMASLSYLLVSAASMLIYLLGVYVIYNVTGTLSYAEIAVRIQQAEVLYRQEIVIGLALMVSAIALRVAVVPVYGWLPDAHAMAPHPVSAILSGVLIKTPLFVLLRLVVLFPEQMQIGRAFAFCGAITALLGVLLALSQSDAKLLLAYHSVSQIGFVVAAWGSSLAAGVGTPAGIALMAASFLHALFHGVFKGVLFLSVGTAVSAAGNRNVYTLRDGMRRLARKGFEPSVVLLAFAAGALSITALPPWSGYVSKNLIVYLIQDPLLAGMLSLASIGTVASFMKLSRIFLPAPSGKASGDTERGTPLVHDAQQELLLQKQVQKRGAPAQLHIEHDIEIRPGSGMAWALAIGAALCLAGGLFGRFIFAFSSELFAAWAGAVSEAAIQGSASATEKISAFSLYSGSTLLKTLLMLFWGSALFGILQWRPVQHVMHGVATRHRTFSGLFLAFFLGTAGLILYLM
mgnify:CR=1 FL=1